VLPGERREREKGEGGNCPAEDYTSTEYTGVMDPIFSGVGASGQTLV